ncbi:unnamed protein product [Strongylus vulgaris]|uniref:Uncharacterized protein n=1 Tax=Strongylus vulgaris TaxID=40348 RepID=A0A3P7L2V2_STRVU|nr:unnamed protein product [Strongylus vulgaris]
MGSNYAAVAFSTNAKYPMYSYDFKMDHYSTGMFGAIVNYATYVPDKDSRQWLKHSNSSSNGCAEKRVDSNIKEEHCDLDDEGFFELGEDEGIPEDDVLNVLNNISAEQKSSEKKRGSRTTNRGRTNEWEEKEEQERDVWKEGVMEKGSFEAVDDVSFGTSRNSLLLVGKTNEASEEYPVSPLASGLQPSYRASRPTRRHRGSRQPEEPLLKWLLKKRFCCGLMAMMQTKTAKNY